MCEVIYCDYLRQSSECVIIAPTVAFVATTSLIEFGESQRIHFYLKSSAAEFGDNIFREKSRVASGDVNIGVIDVKKAVEYTCEILHHLNLIEQNIVGVVIDDFIFYIIEESVGIE